MSANIDTLGIVKDDIIIPDGTQYREPISHTVHNEQVRIVAGEDSQATIELLVSGTVEILVHIQGNATLTVLCLQTKEAIVSQRAHLSGNASIHWQNVSLAPVDHTLESRAEGPHARSDIDWIFYAKNAEKQKISAHNVFEGSDGAGEIRMKGIAQDTAHVECNGLIDIGHNGGGTDTYLTEDVLMLDSSAKVDAIPGLEIKTNDVKASHSATVSKVTPEDLFYFASRGIDETTARQMYIVGFLGDMTKSILSEELRNTVQTAVEKKYVA